jgi:prepilin-type N-terminal cleavage/methylation domain-containing protein
MLESLQVLQCDALVLLRLWATRSLAPGDSPGVNTSRSGTRPGLTLLELIAVLAILVMLAGIVVPMVSNLLVGARSDTTAATLRQLQQVIVNRYAVDMNGAIDISTITDPSPLYFDNVPRATANKTFSPPQLKWLFTQTPNVSSYNSTSRLGWSGPYLLSGQAKYPAPRDIMSNGLSAEQSGFFAGSSAPTSNFGITGDPTVLDGWGSPIVIVFINETTSSQTYYILLSAGKQGVLDSTIVSATPGTAITATISNDNGTTPQYLTIGSSQYFDWLQL